MEFATPQLKSDLMEHLKRKNYNLSLIECGLDGGNRRININNDLPIHVRKLLAEARKLRNHGYQYVWCKMGRVLVSERWRPRSEKKNK